ncbi:MAG: (2Fe-2S) ferredoxin domain-containing protein [Clostridiales bacterium]|jgi:NADH-quinone oxidoreductase subunit G|nr:(2Fe-2S) ferredoxin domain-containing protein [Clostridiales bacterium]
MKVSVCVGSSCHIKGSYDVIDELTRLIKKYGVEDRVELAASFCLGDCASGVAVMSDGIILHNVNKENAEEIFCGKIYPVIKG